MNVQDEIKTLKQRIAELEYHAKEQQGFPMCDDAYWYMTTTGKIFNSNWDGFVSEEYMLEIGNIFKTKEQADFAVEKLKVEAELRKFSRPFKYGKFNYCLLFDIDGNNFRTDVTSYCPSQGAIYFESEDEAIKAIRSVGEERIKKHIFGVED